jgi:hypothetical protein
MRMTAVGTLAAICAIVTGCSGGSPPAAPPPSIRGIQVTHDTCGARTTGTAIQAAPSTVTQLRLCPLEMPNASTVVVTIESGDTAFASLVDDLAAPDEPATNMECPGLADLPQRVIAETGSGPLLVRIPIDDCGLYQAAADSALTAARATA